MSFSLYISTLAVSDTTVLILGKETFFSSKNLHKANPIAVRGKKRVPENVCAEGAHVIKGFEFFTLPLGGLLVVQCGEYGGVSGNCAAQGKARQPLVLKDLLIMSKSYLLD